MQKIQAIRGMNDLLPDASPLWQYFEDTVREVFEQYGYRLMRTPIVEATPLFARAIGEVTDIVEKEMYSFVDGMNGEKLTLRPEATAGLVRAVIEHNLLYNGPQRVWTWGAMFRHERPQKGRYRQFHQFDVEALGFPGPDVDAEQIVMLARLWKRLGIENVTLHVNSIGDVASRAAHREALVKYFESRIDELDEDAKRRLHTNPLRTLDTKNPAMGAVIEAAPALKDFLDDAAREHFAGVTSRLAASGIEFVENPRLVRGFDYYNRTVFEFIGKGKDFELAIAGGGRYDGLIEQLGGKPAPGCGFGIGAERVLMLLGELPAASVDVPDAYVLFQEPFSAQAWRVAESLRDAGLAITLHAGGGSFKSQMKKADVSGARFAIILGESEVAAGLLAVKHLRGGGEQQSLTLQQSIEHLWAEAVD
ncbi:MAG: histidine--tRNA ligase [Betaproteobacteria bacterium]|nr:histidine--tRNA ligase [Betaproteobacteria bacterium]